MKKPRVFAKAIENLESLFPDTGRLAIRALKVLDGAETFEIKSGPELDIGSNKKLAALLVRARKERDK